MRRRDRAEGSIRLPASLGVVLCPCHRGKGAPSKGNDGVGEWGRQGLGP